MFEVKTEYSPKFRVGDVVTPSPTHEGYLHEWLIKGAFYKVVGVSTGAEHSMIDVEGEFQGDGQGCLWGADWFVLAEKPPQESTAESLRKYILTLREEREELVKQLEGIDDKENDAIQKLAGLGFVLYEDNVSEETAATEKKTVLYAEDIEEDMTDSRNWKVGDIIVATSHGYNKRLGVGYRLTKVGETIHYECLDSRFTKNEYADNSEHGWLSSNYKFHSRPVK